MKLNSKLASLPEDYFFEKVSDTVNAFIKNNPSKKIINMGIGDVTLPLCPAVIKCLHDAVDDMSKKESFKGYGPYDGYPFLKESIATHYNSLGVQISPEEIFINDGAAADCANILSVFDQNLNVLITNPTYPEYLDTNITANNNVSFLNATEENSFLPMPNPNERADLIYICSPNNPTGAVYSKNQLKQWVNYAIEQDAIIIFDAAYNAFVQDSNLPKSIFEIENSKNCAIEINSFSKTAGFTGTRCGYTIISNDLKRGNLKIIDLWRRNQSTKTNGVSYIIQRGAQAIFTEEGKQQVSSNINLYLNNAKLIKETLTNMGIYSTGGLNSPYVWFKCFNNMKSWDFFSMLLEKTGIIGIPGVGFGKNGEGFFRFSAFGDSEEISEGILKLQNLI